MRGRRILHHAVSDLTMLKITKFSMGNENDAIILSGKYIQHKIDDTIIKK